MNILEDIKTLVLQLNTANFAYYVNNNPIMSDYEFDLKLKKLQQLEAEYPEFTQPNSPTLHVGSDLSVQSSFKQVSRGFPMGSIENCYDEESLRKWMAKYPNQTFSIEWKKDGTSCSLRYKNGILVEASTRGNGYIGDDITANVMTIKNIPQRLTCPFLAINIEVRGEIMIKKSTFEKINKERIVNGEQPYANCRNLAAGSIKQLDTKVTASRDLIFIPYAIYAYPEYDEGDIVHSWCNSHLSYQNDAIDTLKDLGFETDEHCIACTYEEVVNIINEWKTKKSSLEYDVDGIVIKVNSRAEQELIGYTNKNPKYAIAYKWNVEMASTKLIDIKWQVGRTGKLTPVGILEPVEVEGTTISNVTLNNMDFIREKQIAIGAYYFIYRGGSVIPVLHGPDEARNNENNLKIVY